MSANIQQNAPENKATAVLNEFLNPHKGDAPEQPKQAPEPRETFTFETTKSKAELIQALRVLHTEIVPPPPTAWGQRTADPSKPNVIGTLGNFSVIIGKAKSRKSFAVSIAAAAALSNTPQIGGIYGALPPDQSKVLLFDTEQHRYHVLLAVKRILKQADTAAAPENLEVYGLRSFAPAERLEIIAEIIENRNDVGMVIIDGIKELITSINDEGEATAIASKLLNWTERKNTHIITVLHQNKGNDHARGHIGTELINKAETVLSVTVNENNKEISEVKPVQARNREPEPFSFEIDSDTGLPIIAESVEVREATTSHAFNPLMLHHNQLLDLVTEAFKDAPELRHKDLMEQLQVVVLREYTFDIGDTKVKKLITLLAKGVKGIEIPYVIKSDDDRKAPYIVNPEILEKGKMEGFK